MFVVLQVGRITKWLRQEVKSNALEWSQVRSFIWR